MELLGSSPLKAPTPVLSKTHTRFIPQHAYSHRSHHSHEKPDTHTSLIVLHVSVCSLTDLLLLLNLLPQGRGVPPRRNLPSTILRRVDFKSRESSTATELLTNSAARSQAAGSPDVRPKLRVSCPITVA
jgi:hypothetical protein